MAKVNLRLQKTNENEKNIRENDSFTAPSKFYINTDEKITHILSNRYVFFQAMSLLEFAP